MISDSRIMTYGGESGMSDYWELSLEVLDGGDAADWIIDDAESGILLMIPQTSE